MKQQITHLVATAIGALPAGTLPDGAAVPDVELERTRDPAHGDFATSVALKLAKAAKRKPRELAELLVRSLPASGLVDRVDAYAEVEGRRVRLTRVEGGALDRRDYRLPEARHPLVIELWSTQFGPELLLRQTFIAAGAPTLPGPPDPKRAAQVIAPQPERVQPAAEEPSPLLSWWWVAGGILAAGLAGAAIWQETR